MTKQYQTRVWVGYNCQQWNLEHDRWMLKVAFLQKLKIDIFSLLLADICTHANIYRRPYMLVNNPK